MLRYWNKISTYCYKYKIGVTPEEIHDWLVSAVMYAINIKPWEDEKSNIYQDPTGPDKVINRCMESRRLTYYQQLNRYKRKINSGISSLDSLVDEYKDVFSPTSHDEYTFEYDELIKKYFNDKDYFMSFLIDAIMYADVFCDGDFSKRKVSVHFRNLDDVYCDIFSWKYNLDFDEVKESSEEIKKLNSYNMKRKIEYNLLKLRKKMERDNNLC